MRSITTTGNSAEADDITQDVLVKMLSGLPAWRGEVRFTTWLYRITASANHHYMLDYMFEVRYTGENRVRSSPFQRKIPRNFAILA